MDRREMLGALGATATGLATATTAGAAQAAQRGTGDVHERCAEACVDCAKHCNPGFPHCYRQVQAGKQAHAKAMHLCVDCGDVCATAGKLVARMSPLMTYTCRACAESCEACIKECEALHDAEMRH